MEEDMETYLDQLCLDENAAEGAAAEEPERFTIDDDAKAEWALKKILDERAERDRLLELVNAEQAALNDRRREIEERCDKNTGYLEYLLQQYMATVECRKTKTRATYQLLSGRLVMKRGGAEFKRDDQKLIGWLERTGNYGYIKLEKSPKWADLKKLVDVADGVAVLVGSGEVIEGITVEEKPDVFTVEETKDV